MSEKNQTTTTEPATQTTEKKRRSDIGAGWIRTGIDVATNEKWSLLSIKLTLDGKQYDLTMRKNKYKEAGSSQPDYRIYPYNRDKTLENKTATKKPVDSEEKTEDEPF